MKNYVLLLCLPFVFGLNSMQPVVSLFEAMERDDNLEFFKIAISSKKADINEKNKRGTPILWHLIRGYWDYCGSHVLFTQKAWLEAIDRLIFHGASVRTRSKRNQKTLLHEAALIASGDIIELLLHKKLNINVRDKNGDTPLHYLFKGDMPKINLACVLDKLVHAGARINSVNNKLETPLHYAAYLLKEEQSQKIIPLLLLHGAQVDARDNEGHRAYDRTKVECAQKMLQDQKSARKAALQSIERKKIGKGNLFSAIRSREYAIIKK